MQIARTDVAPDDMPETFAREAELEWLTIDRPSAAHTSTPPGVERGGC